MQQTDRPDRRAFYWHYPHYGNQGGSPGGAVRVGDWKLIEFYEDNRVELYNLRDDLGEQNDLAAEMPDKAAELRQMLHQWRRRGRGPDAHGEPESERKSEIETRNPKQIQGPKPKFET